MPENVVYAQLKSADRSRGRGRGQVGERVMAELELLQGLGGITASQDLVSGLAVGRPSEVGIDLHSITQVDVLQILGQNQGGVRAVSRQEGIRNGGDEVG